MLCFVTDEFSWLFAGIKSEPAKIPLMAENVLKAQEVIKENTETATKVLKEVAPKAAS